MVFKYEDFANASRRCLNCFEKYIEITALIIAIDEMLKVGISDYRCADGIQLLDNSQYGFKILAAAVGLAMDKKINIKVRTLGNLKKEEFEKELDNYCEMFKAAQDWCSFWNNPSSVEIDFYMIYLSVK